jgi:transposase-like protein
VLQFDPDLERHSSFVDKGQSELKNRRCPNPVCPVHGRVGAENIVGHGFYRTRSGKRRRYRCVTCGQTFSSTKGTPYYRLQHRRTRFDAVVALRVEGVSLSAIARVEGIAWNTVLAWRTSVLTYAATRAFPLISGVHKSACPLGIRRPRTIPGCMRCAVAVWT